MQEEVCETQDLEMHLVFMSARQNKVIKLQVTLTFNSTMSLIFISRENSLVGFTI